MPTDFGSILILVGSILAGGGFFVTGMQLYASADSVAELLASKGIPYPKFVAKAGASIEIVLGALAVMGLWLPFVAIAMAIFVLLASAMVHDFWRQTGTARDLEIRTTICNLIMTGGLLGLAAAAL